jgi:signal transduction histidine kinase
MPTTPNYPLARDICLTSGLHIEQRPSWQDLELTRDYRVSFAVIGDRILHTRPVGDAGSLGIPRLFDMRRTVLQEAGLWDRAYCEIKDYDGVSLRHPRLGRVQFTDLITAEHDRGMLRGYWGYGGPRVFRWIMAAGKALSGHPDPPADFVSDYPTAVREALRTLDAPPQTAASVSRRIRRDDWSMALGSYRVEFEVWDDSIIFSRAEGRFRRAAATQLTALVERILSDSECFPEGTFAQISDVSSLRGQDWDAMQYVRKSYLALHEKWPCRGVVVFGTNRTFRGVARIASAVLPFPYLVAANRDEGLRMVRNLPHFDPRPGLLDRLTGKSRHSDKELRGRVTELIQYASTITWNTEGIDDPQVNPRDPLAPLYALLRVLKLDFDIMIEDRDRLQAEVLQAAKISSIGRLAAGMAHELNSPLTAVLGYADHIHRRSTDSESALQAERALRCALRMRDIIDKLSAYSRSDSETKAEPIEVNASLEETLELIAPLMQRHHVVVTRQLEPDLPRVRCTPAQMQSVLFNVLSNAFDSYADSPGAASDSNPVTISTHREGNWVEIICQDRGCGMSHKSRNHAFDPFFTTKDVGEGTGLGLYVTHRIVTGCGGAIQLTSEPGEGTTIHIRFPADSTDAELTDADPNA